MCLINFNIRFFHSNQWLTSYVISSYVIVLYCSQHTLDIPPKTFILLCIIILDNVSSMTDVVACRMTTFPFG